MLLRSLSRLRTPLRLLPQTLSFSSTSTSIFSKSIPRPFPTPRTPTFPPPLSIFSSPFSSRRRKSSNDRPEEEEEEDADEALGGVFVFGRDPTTPPKLFVIQPRLRPETILSSKLSEALNLANSLEERRDGFNFTVKKAQPHVPPHLVVQNPEARSNKHSDTYFGPGTVDNIKCHIKALESENEIDAVFVNATLSGIQQRNLEVAWGKPVLDRVGLIIEIFNAHAETKEAKLQSELAALMYKRSRLVRVRGPGGRLTFGTSGEAEVVSARGRGSGGRGFISGAGETELQLQRRRILERRSRLLAQIQEVRRTRTLQRSSRKRHGGPQGHGLATVAVVGYTNAGKSTLVSALSESDLYSDDRLFATVDPRIRSVILPSGRKALFSDTVGFISDLPHQLVEAFHATLEEVVEADLLVHVLDSSAPNVDEQRLAVLEVLQQIGVSEEKIENMIEVWNKVDLLQKDEGDNEIIDGEFLHEGENEEDMVFSEAEGGINLELSSHEQDDFSEVDDITSELSRVESVDKDGSNGNACELSSIEPVDEAASRDMGSELSQEESCKTINGKETGSSETYTVVLSGFKYTERVQTSAVMGIGLQELLSRIDEKLSAHTSFEKESIGPFERKWRRSYTEDAEKAAEL